MNTGDTPHSFDRVVTQSRFQYLCSVKKRPSMTFRSPFTLNVTRVAVFVGGLILLLVGTPFYTIGELLDGLFTNVNQ